MRQFTGPEKIEQARLLLVTEFPFYGSIFLRLNVFEDATCSTAYTDGEVIGYNPVFMGQHTVLQILGVFVHEVLHVILKHHLRGDLNPAFHENFLKWNKACDYSLNPMIINTQGMDLPPGCLVNLKKWGDNLAEHIFEQLPDEKCPKCGGTGQQGQPQPGQGQGTPCPCQDGMIGEVRPYKGGKANAAERDQAANEVDQWVNAAGMKANNAGRLGGAEKELIKKIVAPVVNWEDELQFLCEEITKDDYTWQAPNQRYVQQGVYLPSMYGRRTVDMLFFIDTSGSLSNKQLTQIMAEVRKIISTFHIRVIVVYWDTAFKGIEIFDESDVLDPDWKLDVTGRGGTKFKDVLNWMDNNLADQDVEPEAVVFFTDLECCDYPDSEPDLPWLWAQVPDYNGNFEHSYLQYKPDWGTHVTIPIFNK
jgi:predicted metal-dependent peptidase